MKKVYVFLSDGFEEIEGLTVVDILRRAKLSCETVSITGSFTITGSHGITLQADRLFDADALKDADALVLPGGLPGTNHLMAHEGLKRLLAEYNAAGKYLTAICAAPSVLGQHGLLTGRKATCYPGYGDKLTGADYLADAKVVRDGNIITSRGMGTAIDFALAITAALIDKDAAESLACTIQYDDYKAN